MRWLTQLVGATILFLVGVGGLYLAGLGVQREWTQYIAITSWPSVDGTVLSSQIITTRGSKGATNCYADIQYAYVVPSFNSAALRSSRLLPIGDAASDSFSEVNRRVNGFPTGTSVRAFYDPNEPRRAFILRQYQAWPLALINLGIWFVGSAAWLIYRWDTRLLQTSVPIDDQWVRLLPTNTFAEHKGSQVAWGAISSLMAIAPAAHAVIAPADNIGGMFWTVVVVSTAWLGLSTWLAIRWLRIAGAFNEPEVFMTPPNPSPGRRIMIMVEGSLKPGVSGTISATLICERVRSEGSGKHRREVRDRLFTYDAVPAEDDSRGSPAAGLLIDAVIDASTTPTIRSWTKTPRTEWRLDVKLLASSGVRHTAKYPIEVSRVL